jgi:hypothetical protein
MQGKNQLNDYPAELLSTSSQISTEAKFLLNMSDFFRRRGHYRTIFTMRGPISQRLHKRMDWKKMYMSQLQGSEYNYE